MIIYKSIIPATYLYLKKSKFPQSKAHLDKGKNLLAFTTNCYNKLPKIKRLKHTTHKLSNIQLYKFFKPTNEEITQINNDQNDIQDKTHINKDTRYIFYLHGGGFCVNSPNAYKYIFKRFTESINCIIYSPEYRLSPDVCWPNALDDCMEAYEFLIKNEKIDPKKIIFSGDSAGGNLSIAICFKLLKNKNLPLPSVIVCFSPWLDLTLNGPSYEFNKKKEKLIPFDTIRKASWLYVKGNFNFDVFNENIQENFKNFCIEKGMPYLYSSEKEKHQKKLRNSLVSPIFFNNDDYLKDFPQLLIHTSSHELLLSDTLIFSRKLNSFLTEQINSDETKNDNDFNKFGYLSEEDLKNLDKCKSFYASGCNPKTQPDIRATVILWKNEIHAFPMFGPLFKKNAELCLKSTLKWILEKTP